MNYYTSIAGSDDAYHHVRYPLIAPRIRQQTISCRAETDIFRTADQCDMSIIDVSQC